MQQLKKKKRTATEQPAEQTEESPKASDTHSVEDIDALLDEIDQVLEENVNEVLVQYRQKGGE